MLSKGIIFSFCNSLVLSYCCFVALLNWPLVHKYFSFIQSFLGKIAFSLEVKKAEVTDHFLNQLQHYHFFCVCLICATY